MKAISSLELAEIISELGEWEGSKVNKIYEVEKRIYFELYKGKRATLLIEAGKRVHLTDFKEAKPKNPPGFCTLLRKRLEGTKLAEIRQHNFDRVVVLKFEGKELHYLIAELFGKGNLILCDSGMKIVQPYKVKFWSSRSVKPKADFVFPPSSPNLLEMDEAGFVEALKESKVNLVSSLVRLGLGDKGQELCDELEIEREIDIGKLSDKEIKSVWKGAKKLLDSIKKSSGLNKALDEKYTGALEDELEGDLEDVTKKAEAKWNKRKMELEKAVEGLGKKIVESKEKGDYIQANNLEIQKILDGVRKDLKAGMGKTEVEKKYGVILEGERIVINTQ